jgi:hypothetical protein
MTATTLLERPARTPARASAVLELRQYTLHPGARDTLVELFEREFVAPQEACGIELVGQFRDLDAPDRFVWLRGFTEHARRAPALAAFYGGPAWRAQRAAANATMIDSDDVLLLRPVRPLGGFALPSRAAADAVDAGIVTITIHHLRDADPAAFCVLFERDWLPRLWDANVAVVATLATDSRANEFPALPVRSGESVFVCVARHADAARAAEAQARIDEALDWSPAFADAHAALLARPSITLRLQPTPRSRLR